MLVLHERKSRVTLAARLTGKTAAETISVMLAVFGRINPALRKSITFDNDTTFAQHTLLRTTCGDRFWRRLVYRLSFFGMKELQMVDLTHVWLPRHIDIDRLSDEEIQDIVITANLTPRQMLGSSRRRSKGFPRKEAWQRRPNSVLHRPVAPRSRIARSEPWRPLFRSA